MLTSPLSRSMTLATALAALTAFILAWGVAPADATPHAKSATGSRAIALAAPLEARVIRRVNTLRRARGLRPLRRNLRLRRAARGHARHLARTGMPSHVGRGGTSFRQRIAASGYPSRRRFGESVAVGHGCGRRLTNAIVASWMRSAPHRAVLMGRGFRRVGVGAVRRRSCALTSFVFDAAS